MSDLRKLLYFGAVLLLVAITVVAFLQNRFYWPAYFGLAGVLTALEFTVQVKRKAR